MASESTTTRESGKARTANGGDAVQTAVHEVRGAIEGVSRSMPDMARASRSAVDDMFKAIESGSDERVTAGVTLSLGMAIGMLLGGAPRLLIALALAPVAAMGLVLADRRARATRATGTTRATA